MNFFFWWKKDPIKYAFCAQCFQLIRQPKSMLYFGFVNRNIILIENAERFRRISFQIEYLFNCLSFWIKRIDGENILSTFIGHIFSFWNNNSGSEMNFHCLKSAEFQRKHPQLILYSYVERMRWKRGMLWIGSVGVTEKNLLNAINWDSLRWNVRVSEVLTDWWF